LGNVQLLSTYAGKVKAKSNNESAQKLRTSMQHRLGGGRGGNWKNSFEALQEDDDYTHTANQITKQQFDKATKDCSDVYFDGRKHYKNDGYTDAMEEIKTSSENNSEFSDPSSSKQHPSMISGGGRNKEERWADAAETTMATPSTSAVATENTVDTNDTETTVVTKHRKTHKVKPASENTGKTDELDSTTLKLCTPKAESILINAEEMVEFCENWEQYYNNLSDLPDEVIDFMVDNQLTDIAKVLEQENITSKEKVARIAIFSKFINRVS
jgi:hypothetical protein